MELGFSPIITNTFTGYSHVSNFASLPSAASCPNQYFIVDNPSGVWLINRKEAGFYKSDGINWNFVGSSVDMTSLSDGTTSVTASPITLQGTNGIMTSADTTNNKIAISGASLPQISSGTNAPTTTPSKAGDIYIDTCNYKTYISKGNSSSADWVKQNGSYVLQASTYFSISPNSNTSYYFGSISAAAGSLANYIGPNKIYIPRSGTVKNIYGGIYQNPGSAETSSIYLEVNSATDYLISNNISNSSSSYTFNNTSLNIPVSAGNYILLKWVTPTWATLPTYSSANAVIEVAL